MYAGSAVSAGGDPDPARPAEEAGWIWDAVAHDTPEDVWVYDDAGLEYGAIGEHETALLWLARALELAVRTGDPEGLVASCEICVRRAFPRWAASRTSCRPRCR